MFGLALLTRGSPACGAPRLGTSRCGGCPHPLLFPPPPRSRCARRRYVDADGAQTEVYPANPNGSPLGIAGMCSENGRHLAMMPHPERCFLTWQLPYVPQELGLHPKGPAPWIKLFQNAREWAESQK